MHHDIEIVHTSDEDDFSKSAETLIRYVQALTPQSTLPLRQWQRLAQVCRTIGEYVERRVHETEPSHGPSI